MKYFRWLALVLPIALFPGHVAASCGKDIKKQAPKRIVLWNGTVPELPFNERVDSAVKGDTLTFGDGKEFKLGTVMWGESTKTYGKAFRLQTGKALWVPYFTSEPVDLATYGANAGTFLAYGTPFRSLANRLKALGVPHLKVLETGFQQQYYVIEALPVGSISMADFRDRSSDARKAMGEEEVMAAAQAGMEFAGKFESVMELESSAANQILYYHPSRGWFLREWTKKAFNILGTQP